MGKGVKTAQPMGHQTHLNKRPEGLGAERLVVRPRAKHELVDALLDGLARQRVASAGGVRRAVCQLGPTGVAELGFHCASSALSITSLLRLPRRRPPPVAFTCAQTGLLSWGSRGKAGKAEWSGTTEGRTEARAHPSLRPLRATHPVPTCVVLAPTPAPSSLSRAMSMPWAGQPRVVSRTAVSYQTHTGVGRAAYRGK